MLRYAALVLLTCHFAFTADSAAQTPLVDAAENQHWGQIAPLLDSESDVNQTHGDGMTALHWATLHNDVDSVTLFAAREGRLYVVLHLIDAGVDVNSTIQPEKTIPRGARTDMSALLLAVENGHFELAMEWVKCGADSNIWDQKNKWGATPVMIASGKRPGSFKPSPETIAALESIK